MNEKRLHNKMIVGDFRLKETPHSEVTFCLHAIVRMFVVVGTVTATFSNQTNVNGAIERNVIPAMTQSKVKVHNILSRPRGI